MGKSVKEKLKIIKFSIIFFFYNVAGGRDYLSFVTVTSHPSVGVEFSLKEGEQRQKEEGESFP